MVLTARLPLPLSLQARPILSPNTLVISPAIPACYQFSLSVHFSHHYHSISNNFILFFALQLGSQFLNSARREYARSSQDHEVLRKLCYALFFRSLSL